MNDTKGNTTRKKIIEESAKLFYINGYTKTGISDILKSANIAKGSFYFHFKSKKELAISVCDYLEDKLKEWFLLRCKDNTFSDFINLIAEDMINAKKRNEYFGCPLTTIANELSNSEPGVAIYYYESIKKIEDLFSYILKKSGIKEQDSKVLSRQVFALYEGYLVIFRISKDSNVLTNMKDDMIYLYKKYL